MTIGDGIAIAGIAIAIGMYSIVSLMIEYLNKRDFPDQ